MSDNNPELLNQPNEDVVTFRSRLGHVDLSLGRLDRTSYSLHLVKLEAPNNKDSDETLAVDVPSQVEPLAEVIDIASRDNKPSHLDIEAIRNQVKAA